MDPFYYSRNWFLHSMASRLAMTCSNISMRRLLCSQWFTAIDRDNNGRLDVWELQRALALGNLHFSLQLVAHLIRLQAHPPDHVVSSPPLPPALPANPLR